MIPHPHNHICTLPAQMPASMPDCVATGLVICKAVANTDLYVYHNTAEK